MFWKRKMKRTQNRNSRWKSLSNNARDKSYLVRMSVSLQKQSYKELWKLFMRQAMKSIARNKPHLWNLAPSVGFFVNHRPHFEFLRLKNSNDIADSEEEIHSSEKKVTTGLGFFYGRALPKTREGRAVRTRLRCTAARTCPSGSNNCSHPSRG